MEVWQLRQRQSLPLNIKEKLTERRIVDWYEHFNGNVYVSFSGGKDSTVLLDLVRKIYPNVQAIFSDTGLEYPEIRDFVKTVDNVIWLKPKVPFNKIIEKYGYPIVSKEVSEKIYELRNSSSEKVKQKILYGDLKGNGKISNKWKYLVDAPFKISSKCCYHLKKSIFRSFEYKNKIYPYIGTMASDSLLRETNYLKYGCNSFDSVTHKQSLPISFWTEKDIWEYINKYNLPYSEIYNMGYNRTGCMFCMFGVHMEKGLNRFQKMKVTHPKQYNYCINKLDLKSVLEFLNIPWE